MIREAAFISNQDSYVGAYQGKSYFFKLPSGEKSVNRSTQIKHE
jgi:hypothetical protein